MKLGNIRQQRHGRQRFSTPFFVTLCFAVIMGGISIPCGNLKAASNSYIAGFEGLPLMPGLTEKAEDRVIFDTPAGRIVEATTWGAVSASSVEGFYKNTLPQLGWRGEPSKDGQLKFEREGERLSIEFSPGFQSGRSDDAGAPAKLIVRFTIRPIATP